MPNRITTFCLACLGLLCCSVSADVTFQYYRFVPLQLRDNGVSMIQLADFTFYSEDGPLEETPLVTNPGGNNPDNERPANLTDFDSGTKWLDFNRQALIFHFPAPVTIDHFGFTTANDAASRDPVRWILEGSLNGETWTLLDDRSGSSEIYSTDRYASHEWNLNQVSDAPSSTLTLSTATISSPNALNIATGTTATIHWTTGDATTVVLSSQNETLANSLNGSLSVSPTTTTSYTLSASSEAGTTIRTVTLYVNETELNPMINEFLSDPSSDKGLLDEDGEPSDWIEIYNPNPFALSLNGFSLTDDPSLSSIWPFPTEAIIQPEEHLLVFASSKNRSISGEEWHTSFKLAKEGEYLALIESGNLVLQDFAPYPPMFEDASYGARLPSEGLGFDHFTTPTPRAQNDTPPGAPGGLVEFLVPPGTFTSSTQVSLQTSSPLAEIRYTTDGQIPTQLSSLYTGPFTLTESTLVKARTFETGRAPGKVKAESFLKLSSNLTEFTSDLPVVILENFNAGAVPSSASLQATQFSLFEPDETTGRTNLTSVPTDSHLCGIKRRGSSTLNNPKGNYRVEFWQDGSEDEKDVRLLGLSSHDEWILYAPYNYDRTLIRNALLFGLSNEIGAWAPGTRFCEVYLNTDGGELLESDYQGVYVLMERISRNRERVDIEKLDPSDNDGDEVTGGYILSIDRRDPEDLGFRSTRGHPFDPPNANPQPYFNHVYPKEQNLTSSQASYIRGYLDDLENVLYGPDFQDPTTGYRAWLDAAASIDHHIMVAFSKDPDGLRLSTYLTKPRGEKIAFGPIWDFDRSMGPDDDNRAADPVGWQGAFETTEFFEYDYWGRLFQDPDFMQDWIDRWQELRRDEFSALSLTSRINSLANSLSESQIRNAQRWPTAAPNGGPLSPFSGYTGEVDHLKNWVQQRADWIDSQFTSPPSVPAGGQVAAGSLVHLGSTVGTTYFTLDGTDPRLPGGQVRPGAFAISSSGEVQTSFFSQNDAQVQVLRPTSPSPGPSSWTQVDFDSSSWMSGQFGVGYESSGAGTYTPHLSTIVHSGSGAPTSIYLRVPFVAEVRSYTSLTLRMKYDDGFVAYLNGTPVLSRNASVSPSWNAAATTSHDDSLAINFIDFDLSAYANLLLDGENILAIHALNDGTPNSNNTGSTSSDMLISAELLGTYAQSTSEEIIIDDTTTIVARNLIDGNWSGDVTSTFVVGMPASSTNLVVSEIMYHPANPTHEEELAGFTDDSEFEFLELRNVSTDTIDLSGLVISECFDFDFAGSEIVLLAPGDCILVVRNRAAFELRYGTGFPIAGAWGDSSQASGGSKLSNGGERIVLTATNSTLVQDFSYHDQSPWPVAPDGEGSSLELTSPFTLPDHSQANNWRASAPGGTPGSGESVFQVWAATHFSAEQLNDASTSGPTADPDGDGLANCIELAFGGNPLVPSPDLLPSHAIEEIAVADETLPYLTITFTRDPSVPGVLIQPEFGSDLRFWPDAGVLVSTTVHSAKSETVTYRTPHPVSNEQQQFARVRVSHFF
ncbi:CotH kinase family protein [Roseibacillus persicicus]|uniref:CotH kinase family protein n=1 Tax=Roseibacillus persicicus TaxID=454148 RepID=UPI00398B5B7A